MKLTLGVGQCTHPGHIRETNEDSLCVLVPPQLVKDFDALLVVADGMGGHCAGEIASQYVANTLRDLFSSTKYQSWVSFDPHREDYTILVVKEVIERLNDELYQMANRREDWRGMGTTITAVLVVADRAFIGHVGDSRAYLFSKGAFRQLTKDHSWVMEQVEQGTMTPEQANSDPRKNQITRAVGSSNLIKVDRIIEPLQPDDALLFCSDGLSNMVSDAEMLHALQTIADPQTACETLVELANQHGGTDNITIIIARANAGGNQPAIVGRAARHEPAEAFSIHDTQPLGPVEQFRGRSKKSGEPVRISPPLPAPQPETRVAIETKPSDEQAAIEPEVQSPQTVPLALSQAAEQPSSIQSDAQTNPLEQVTPPAARPQKSNAISSVIPVVSMIVYALIAATVNGGVVYAYSQLPSQAGVPIIYLAIAVAVCTLLFTILGFIFFVLLTGSDSENNSNPRRSS